MLKQFAALLLLLPTVALAETFVAGTDYQVLPVISPGVKNQPATVIEFFSYGCPWCFKLEVPIAGWVKTQGKKIHFERVPVVFHKEWELYAKAFYIAQTISQSEKLNPLLFKAIQVDKKPLDSNDSMEAFFVNQGIDKSLVQSAFEHSTTVDMLVKSGMETMAKYQVNAVPAFVINWIW
jgi:thiol:disulfide interchange protein DsbA